jgi:hypothetical protein
MRPLTLKRTGFAILLAVGIFCLWLMLNATMKNTFELDPDEGTNLIKTDLYLKGYNLYKQIWSDQPPLFTVMLSFWFKLFGTGTYYARLLALLFSLSLLWGLYLTIRIRANRQTALAACIFLLFSSGFLRLSISVMIGIPSLALAIYALYNAAVFSQSRSRTRLFLSAAFMSLSLLTKFSGIVLAPLILSEITFPQEPDHLKVPGRKNSLMPAIIWLGISLAIYFFVLGVFLYPDLSLFYQQLFQPHLAGQNIPNANFTVIIKSLARDLDIVLLAITAICFNLFSKNYRIIILPAVWLGIAIPSLVIYKPVWYHHYLLVSIPVCWLAGIVFVQFIQKIKTEKRKTPFFYLAAALVILAAVRAPLKFQDALTFMKQAPMGEEGKILDLISRFKKNSTWIFTDLPIFAFNSRILVPPETAVLTLKRLPTAKSVELALKKYKPELVLLGRFTDYDREIISGVENDYHKEREILIRRPVTNTVCLWQPISTFLPSQIQLSAGKRLKHLNWNLKIPIVKPLSYFYYQRFILYTLKTNAGQI